MPKTKTNSKTKSKTRAKSKAKSKIRAKTRAKTRAKSKTRSKSKSCPRGQIMRSGYLRKHYTKTNGTLVNPTVVPEHCIKDRGNPGHGVQLFRLVPGVLEGYGYYGIKNLTQGQRRKALNRALDDGFEPLSLFRRINALYVLNKNQDPGIAELFKKDRDYVKTTKAYAERKTAKKTLNRSKSKSKSKSKKSKSKSKGKQS